MKKLLFALMLGLMLPILLFSAQNKQLIFYCGITMVKPMTEIAKIMEKKHGVKISISQGGSQDLFDALSYAKRGDMYLPGSDSYLKKNEKLGFFEKRALVGHNKAAIFVQKGNPKNINTIEDLLNPKVRSMLCDTSAGSIGRESKNILINYKNEDFYYEVFDKAVLLGTDSRNLNKAIKDKTIDATINWKSTAFFDENKDFIDAIDIDSTFAKPKKLVLTQLSFSEHKDVVSDFIDFASSKKGQDIMRKYGF